MPAITTGFGSGAGILAPEELGPLIIQPLRMRSVALRVSTVIETLRHDLRFPIVENDAAAAWVVEADDINVSSPGIGELTVTPSKVAALTKVSNELIADSAENAQAAAVVGDGLVRQFARTIDQAFFTATTSLGPNGLESIAYQTVDVTGPFVDVDPFADAISLVERVGSVVTAFATSFSTANHLAKLKRFQPTIEVVNNEPLLAQSEGDVSNPVNRTIFGVPLYSAPEGTIEDGVVWAIAADKVFTVMRSDISILANPFFFFGSDSTAVRGTMRLGYGFPHEAAVVKITASVPGS
jgi:HK97 family phage major capsid protein